MKRTDKVKAWAKKHQDGIVTTGVVGGAVALYAGFLALAWKAEKQQAAAYDEVRSGVLNGSKIVLPNRDGSFMVIDKVS